MIKRVLSEDPETRAFVSYSIGFLASIGLTIAAYAIVVHKMFSMWMVIFIISGLALLQLIIQLLFFLHLGNESSPRWKFIALLSTMTILIIIVGGSLWIMSDLDSRVMMSPTDMIKYMNRQTGL